MHRTGNFRPDVKQKIVCRKDSLQVRANAIRSWKSGFHNPPNCGNRSRENHHEKRSQSRQNSVDCMGHIHHRISGDELLLCQKPDSDRGETGAWFWYRHADHLQSRLVGCGLSPAPAGQPLVGFRFFNGTAGRHRRVSYYAFGSKKPAG